MEIARAPYPNKQTNKHECKLTSRCREKKRAKVGSGLISQSINTSRMLFDIEYLSVPTTSSVGRLPVTPCPRPFSDLRRLYLVREIARRRGKKVKWAGRKEISQPATSLTSLFIPPKRIELFLRRTQRYGDVCCIGRPRKTASRRLTLLDCTNVVATMAAAR